MEQKHVCQSNHQGIAAAMEPVGAMRIFERSITTRGLRYTKYLEDWDSSSFKKFQRASLMETPALKN